MLSGCLIKVPSAWLLDGDRPPLRWQTFWRAFISGDTTWWMNSDDSLEGGTVNVLWCLKKIMWVIFICLDCYMRWWLIHDIYLDAALCCVMLELGNNSAKEVNKLHESTTIINSCNYNKTKHKKNMIIFLGLTLQIDGSLQDCSNSNAIPVE